MPDEAPTPEEIWTGDLFDRKTEAEQLIAYIESVVARPVLREDKRAYTIAIDARYGEGKSFFLKRLAQHMALNHPVAFVDAWADDLADEPLTALAATLKQALEPFVDEPEVQDRLRTFMSKTGKVTKIAALGLLRRGLGLALTGGAVDAAADVLSGVSDDVSDAVNDGIKDASLAQVEEVGQAIRGVTAHRLMEERVNAFEEGKAAVQEMKDSLSAIVESLSGETLHPPIIIVIDELDRCRPTYAIKLLEEIKHLFDVPGLVFILALHADQLAHSVSGAYGSTFDGRAYLRRFIDREYALAEPPLSKLLNKLCDKAGLTKEDFRYPSIARPGQELLKITLPELVGEYMRLYGLAARDAFGLIDRMQTCKALAGVRCCMPHIFYPC
ncbi:KAP family P-loop NTPase fold protein [Sphingomonas panni]